MTNAEPPAKRIQPVTVAVNASEDEGLDNDVLATNVSSHANTAIESAPFDVPVVITQARSSNPNANLDALPNELLNGIFGYLSRRPLARLSRVSRKLNEVAVPILYGEGISPSVSERRRRGFTHTITGNPMLGKMVKKIRAVYTVSDLAWEQHKNPALTKRKDGDAWTERKYKNEESRWIEDEVDITGREARLLDLALSAATNVEQLCIKDVSTKVTPYHRKHDFWWIELLVGAAKGNPLGPTKTFAKLKKLTISLEDHIHGWLRLEKLSLVLQLPSLEDLTLSGLVEDEQIADWGCPEGESNVKKLTLENSFISKDVIVQLLSSCKGLTHVTSVYTTTNNFAPMNPVDDPKCGWAEHSWAVIGKQLQRHKATLRALNLVYDTDPTLVEKAAEHDYDVELGSLGSLKDFKNLKSLSAPIDALIPHDAGAVYLVESLPKGIESLDVRFDALTTLKLDLFGRMMELLATSRSNATLKTVHISLGDGVKVQNLELEGSVRSLQVAGVKTLVTRDFVHRLGRPVTEIHGDVCDADFGIDDFGDDETDDESDEDD